MAPIPTGTAKRDVRATRVTAWFNPRMSDHFTLRLLDESMRREAHPLVRFADGPSGRRATLVGSGLDVWEVIAAVRDNANDLDEAASVLEIAPGLVQAAVSYYGEYKDEIDAEVALNRAEWERGYAAWESGETALGA